MENKITGRLVEEPILKVVENTKTINFKLAVYQDDDVTDVYQCTAFTRMGEMIMQQCKKGSKISISGATNEENEMIVSFVEFESME
ncbi:single-stranded DNA-binding protein [Amedibacillus dolichus]|uniref:single-stranded DNA-binding protein n=1 Tax=Amedibacillus dolichus TaxID=31971 RepID=UPI0024303FCD|nr:single-stranded DNA-binding protein [Amedibacillus dolichus]